MLYRSNLFAVASGSLDGTVFSHNSSGRYVRNRTIPTNPNTSRQSTIRTAFGNSAIAWGTFLTDDQRAAWEVYAKNVPSLNRIGDEIFPSGFNHFVRSSTPRLQAGLLPIGPGPTELTLEPRDPQFDFSVLHGPQFMTVNFDDSADWVSEDDAAMMVGMGIPRPPAHNFFGGPWRFAGVILGDSGTPPTSPQTLSTPYVIGADQKVWGRARITRADGRLSTFSRNEALTEL